ncbi:DUF4302 domain-containing protein [Sphingobacterium olei]|uniref:DUF4302 domain-containing protein n=1 Tax=Sphingobacterium olei TaxID=2571155 RepID=A0A4U0NHR8_9SPHI|nr:DUF4302 domain-containing protein [Sphingobacterium olei]TJZ53767.1 DUF4302 domain-containing protein [Sphingobacterium olei]
MRKILYHLFFFVGSIVLLASCEKDNITNAYFEDNTERQEKVAKEAKEMLASAENGWVMMVKTGLNSDVYTPIVLKFDTVTNRLYVKTVYGETADTESYFRITTGTGAPQLIFTTGSIMSSLYRVGAQASDITDHIYNIVGVSSDTVAIQCYRSGNVYAKEGGVIYKMFKRPVDWKWADGENYFDFNASGFGTNVLGTASRVQLEYVNSPEKNRTIASGFSAVAAANLSTMRNGFAFQISRNIGTGGFAPTNYVFFRFPYLTTNYDGAPIFANNALSFLPQPAGYTNNVTYMTYFINTFNFHYLVCKSVVRTGNNVKMEFEAYDKAGKVIVKATYDNLL